MVRQAAFSSRVRANGTGFWMFKRARTNLRPEVEVESLGFKSLLSHCAPFLVALTLE